MQRIKKQLSKLLPGFVKGALVRNKVKIRTDLSERFIFKVAETRQEREQAYRLTYEAYCKRGFIEPHSYGLHFSVQHAHPHTATFIGLLDGEVVITISLIPDSVLGLPMDKLYSKELDRLRSRGRFIAEVGTLASSPKVRTGLQQLPMMMNNIMQRYAKKHLGVDDLVLTVNPAHELVYRHMILCKRIGRNKPYETVNGHIAVPMRLDLLQCERRYYRYYRRRTIDNDLHYFFFTQPYENVLLPEKRELSSGFTEDDYYYFFEERTKKGQELDPDIRKQLFQIYQDQRVKTVPLDTQFYQPVALTKVELNYLAAQLAI